MVVAIFDFNNSMQAGQLSDQAINNGDFFVIYSKPITFEGDPAIRYYIHILIHHLGRLWQWISESSMRTKTTSFHILQSNRNTILT